ncbi:MAG: FG-GAP repeat domain-containing protein, partial [Terriglobales bacterium]
MNRRTFLSGLAAVAAVSRSLPEALAGSPQETSAPGFRLVDVTTPAGIQFQHNSGAFGGKLLPETLGSGCAFLDYDGDGWQDILLVNGMDWPGHKRQRSTLKLYRNDRNGTFSDV